MTAEADHLLTADAVDAFGNATHLLIRFAIDKTAPEIQVAGNADGEVTAAAQVTPTFTATDAHLDRVTATLDGNPFASGTTLTTEADYVLVVTATDKAGNTATRTVRFAIDRTPPAITVAGVTDGEVTTRDVTPTVTFFDLHLATTSLLLDGRPFVSGTTLTSEADYVLEAAASDKAGNTARVVVTFAIDRTPPAIALSGFVPGACTASDVVPSAAVFDLHAVTVKATLDGLPFVLGTAVTTEGHHVLLVQAEDAAGNASAASGMFTIDKTAPSVTVTGVEDGRLYLTEPAAFATASDANLVSFDVTLDGAPYASGTPIAADGQHVLVATAVDCAGNRTLVTVRFEVFVVRATLSLTATSPRAVLVGFGCNAAGGPAGCPAPSAVLTAAMFHAGLRFETANTDLEFLTALRANRHRAYVLYLRPSPARIGAEELVEHVFEGAGLLVVTRGPHQEPELVDPLGLSIGGTLPQATLADFLAAGFAPAGPVALSGGAIELRLATATAAAATGPKQETVAAANRFGLGTAIALGFDPEASTSTRMEEVLSAALGAASSGPVPPFVPLSPIDATASVTNLSPSTRTFDLAMTVPGTLLFTAPPATTLSPLTWLFTLGSGGAGDFTAGIRLPASTGAFTVTADLSVLKGATSIPVTSASATLTVPATGASRAASAASALAALSLSGLDDAMRRNALRELSAVDFAPSTRSGAQTSIDRLLAAIRFVARIRGAPVEAIRLDLAAALRSLELQWTMLP